MTDPRETTAPFDPERPEDKDSDFQVTQNTSGDGTPAVPPRATGPVPNPLASLAPAMNANELGRLGSYRILEVLGRGGMGVVFRAEDRHLRRQVAVKVMRPELTAGPVAAERFLREARAAAAVKHDHIVTIYQVGQDRGIPFIAMEFLTGEPLDARAKREGRLPPFEVMRIGHEMALGLAAAHEVGLIHRDVKPGNVWLEAPNGRVKLLDFGLARAAKDHGDLTDSRAVVGTPSYMPLEQANGNEVDHRADLYSLGVVLYRLVTGELPFQGDSPLAVLSALAFTNPVPPSTLVPGIPTLLNDLILQLLARNPVDRVQTAREVADLLAPAVRSVTVVHVVGAADAPAYNEEFAFEDGATELDVPPATTISEPAPKALPAPRRPRGRGPVWPLYAVCVLAAVVGAIGVSAIVRKARQKPVEPPPVEETVEKPVVKPVAPPKPTEKPKPPPENLPPFVPHIPANTLLDELDAAKIPDAEKADFLPKETVAVFGSGERRTWGGPITSLLGGLGYSPDGKHLVACDFMNLYLYDAETLRLKARQPLGDFNDSARGFAFSPDSRTLYSVKSVTVWDLTRGGMKQLVEPGLARHCYAVAASLDGQYLATVTNGSGTIVDLTKRDQPSVFEWKGGSSRWWDLRFSPDSRWLLAAEAGSYRVFRFAEGKWTENATLKVAGGRVSYSFTDKRKVAVVLGGGVPVLVDLAGETAKEIGPAAGLDSLADFTFDATGEKWAATRFNYLAGPGELILGDWQGDKLRETARLAILITGYVAYAPDGKSVAVHGDDRAIHVWDVAKNPPVERSKFEVEPVQQSACKPDGSAVATLSLSGQLTLWDWPAGKPRRKATIETGKPQGYCAWLPDGKRLLTVSYPQRYSAKQHECKLWEVTADGWKEVTRFELAEHQLWTGIVFTPDCKRAVIGNTLWDFTGDAPKQTAEFLDANRGVKLLDVSPDGRQVVFAVGGGRVQLHDIDKHDTLPLATTALAGEVLSVRFSPDGRSILTNSRGGHVVKWEVKGNELVEKVRFTNSADGKAILGYHLTNAAFTPDGSRVFVGTGAGVTEHDATTGVAIRGWSLPGACYPQVTTDGRHLVLHNINGTAFVLRLQGAPVGPPEK